MGRRSNGDRQAATATRAGGSALGKAMAIPWVLPTAVLGGLLWSYWPMLRALAGFWESNSDYSAGALVPLVAGYVVWSSRKALRAVPMQPCWWGLGVLVLSQLVRPLGLLLSYGSAEQYSFVLAVFAATLLVFGSAITRRLFWVLVFLVLMLPLPRRIHSGVLVPLQEFATASAVTGLEMLGNLVVRQGNILRMSDQNSVAVAEACSGLRLLTAFMIVGAALAFVVRRPRWQKAILVLATIPVAIFSNTLRLVATVLVYEHAGKEWGDRFFHDFAGLTMVPFAFAALLGLLWLMRWVSGAEAEGPQAPRRKSRSAGRSQPAVAGSQTR